MDQHEMHPVSISTAANSSSHHNTGPLASNKSSISSYLEQIQSCYIKDSNAASYFHDLEAFLETNSRAQLQEIKCIKVERHTNLGSGSGATVAIHSVRFDSCNKGTRICILEGLPSPHCVAALGERYQLRPEFLLNHLNLSSWNPDRPEFCETPAVPSRRENLIHIRLITLGRNQGARSSVKLQSHTKERMQARKSAQGFDRCLFEQRRYGEARFRRVHIHNAEYFSTEQLISFCVAETGTSGDASWAGVFLLDNGPSIEDNFQLPWRNSLQCNARSELVPPVAYHRRARIPEKTLAELKKGRVAPASGFDQYHPILDIAGVSSVDVETLNRDPFFILSRVYDAISLSWTQILNVMEEDITHCHEAPAEESAEALEQLQFNTGLLDRFRGFLTEDLDVIDRRGSLSWVTSRRCPSLDDVEAALSRDYRFLIKRAEMLTKRCEMSSSILVSKMGVLESQKSISQAQQVNILTRLAFFYIPMSFVAALFGMNVKEIATLPSIWVFFAVAVPLTLLSVCLALWSSAKFRHQALDAETPKRRLSVP